MSKKVLIIGGVAGGASAAARLRRLDEEAEIIILEKGEYISFANCGLPYYIGEVILEKDKLVVQTPEKMKERFNIDVRVFNEAISIDRENKKVKILDHVNNKIYEETYDKLVLSPGAEPVRPPLPGADSKRVFTLRNIPDTYRIKEFVDNNRPKRAVVVGAGFIGLEMAENLHKRGIKVTVVELADQVMSPLDYDMAAIVHQHLKSKNVEFYLKDAVKSFIDTDSYTVLELASGRTIKADMVVMGIGVKPDTKLARNAGLNIGVTGGIQTDAHMLTNDPSIYAVGDAVEVKDFISGRTGLVPLAGPANKQGRIAADNICGRDSIFEGTQGTSIVKVFDITVAITGNNEKTLLKNKETLLKNKETLLKNQETLLNNQETYEKCFTHSPSHAGYYPGAIPMAIKLIFSKPEGRILGAQIIGYDGVDKRIDIIATAIRAKMTVFDLEKLELAYAPPYSSAKDPVNIAGFAATNILKGDTRIFHWNNVAGLDRENSVLLDVRSQMENKLGTIEGSLNIPVDELRQRISELPVEKDIYVFCQVGLRGYIASRILMQNGFKNVFNLSGGYKTYQLSVQKQANEDIYEYEKITKDDEIKPVDYNYANESENKVITLDACGLQCPGPIMQTYKAVQAMNHGEILKIKATDPAFREDIKTWCDRTGNRLLGVSFEDNAFTALVRKDMTNQAFTGASSGGNDKTMVIFSNDLDKAIASFIIANGAAAMGRKVTLFFTFWGLNILRKPEKVKTRKDIFARMFGMMMPRGSRKLSLSKMNMMGMGPVMIRFMMKKKNVTSLEELISQALENGVNLVACNMSMDIMGIKKEELIEGVNIGGVATFLGSAELSDMSLFI